MPGTDTLVVRRLALLACVRVGAAVGAVLGGTVGVLLAATLPLVTTFWSDFAELQGGTVAAALVLIPLGSVVAGGVAGGGFALVFNAVAQWTGGVLVTVERPAGTPSPTSRPPAAPDEASW